MVALSEHGAKAWEAGIFLILSERFILSGAGARLHLGQAWPIQLCARRNPSPAFAGLGGSVISLASPVLLRGTDHRPGPGDQS